MLNIVASYHRIQFHGKLMIQTREYGEKPHFGPDLGSLDPNSGPLTFFYKSSTWTLFQAIILCNLKEN